MSRKNRKNAAARSQNPLSLQNRTYQATRALEPSTSQPPTEQSGLALMWDIYSIGDSAFLAAVLNSVAMIADTGAIGQLAGIGFLLAVLPIAVQGLMAENGPRFPYQQVFVAAIVYMLMYGLQAKYIHLPARSCDLVKNFKTISSICFRNGWYRSMSV